MHSYVDFTFPQTFIPKKIKKTVRTVCGPFAANINWRKTTCNERCPAGLVVDMRIKKGAAVPVGRSLHRIVNRVSVRA